MIFIVLFSCYLPLTSLVPGVYITFVILDSGCPVSEVRSFYVTQLTRCSFPPDLRKETSGFRKVVFSNFFNTGQWTKSKNLVIPSVVHHRQNPLESRYIFGLFGLLLFLIYTFRITPNPTPHPRLYHLVVTLILQLSYSFIRRCHSYIPHFG
jgi:hypothetical protein